MLDSSPSGQWSRQLDRCKRGDNQTAPKPVARIVSVNHDAMIFAL